MTCNQDIRNANQVIRERQYILRLCSTTHLFRIAKAMARDYEVPQKVMLKAMARYSRLHHAK